MSAVLDSILQDNVAVIKAGTPTDKKYAVVAAKNGLFEQRSNEICKCTIKVAQTSLIKDAIEESIEWLIPKVPYCVFTTIVEFFKKVNNTNNSEVMVQVFKLPDGFNETLPADGQVFEDTNGDKTIRWFLYIPDQSVTGGSVKLIRNVELEQKALHVMDIHSHNSMGAFWSGTDDNDELGHLRIFGVIGKLNGTIEYKFRLGLYNRELALGDVFKIEKETIAVPEKWITKVKAGLSTEQEKVYSASKAELSYGSPLVAGLYQKHGWYKDPRNMTSLHAGKYGQPKFWFEAEQFSADSPSVDPRIFTHDKADKNSFINLGEHRMLTIGDTKKTEKFFVIPTSISRNDLEEFVMWLCSLGYDKQIEEALQVNDYEHTHAVAAHDFTQDKVQVGIQFR